MPNKNKRTAILTMKCPRCYEGDMYSAPITKGIYKMHKECPVCHQPYELEPGFFWGAMYVGYGLSAGYMLTSVAIMILGFGWSINLAFLISILGGIVIFPLVARLARTIWIHIYVAYDKNFTREQNNHKENTVKHDAVDN